jgi:hypothetical protein
VAAGEFASDQYRISCDPVLAVAESNEDNNISAVKTVTVKMPELEVQSLVVSPANCVSQQTVTASAWFMNTGNKTVSAVGAVYVKKQGSWTKLNEKSWEFAPSVRQNLTADISGYPNGQYEFKAVIDEADAVEEINETNNIKDGVILTIADPDLKITSVSAQSESVLPSQVTTLKINILNDSASACSDSFTVAVEIGAGEGVWSSLGQFSVPGIGGSQEIAVDFEYTAPADFGSLPPIVPHR